MLPSARQAALAMLARRDLTAAELTTRLARKGHAADVVAAVVEDLRDAGAIDERRVATVVAADAVRRRHGRMRALQTLAARGVPDDIARDVVAAAFSAVDEAALVDAAIATRLRSGAPDEAAVRRLHRQLLRLGHTSGAIAAALRRHGLWPRG